MRTKIAALVVAAATAAVLLGGLTWHRTGGNSTQLAGWAWDQTMLGRAAEDSVAPTADG